MEITKEHMALQKAQADLTLKFSASKAELLKLQETETEYLEQREKRAVAKIQKALEDSRELLTETEQNYHEVHRFHETVAQFADFLVKTHNQFKEMLSDFDKRSESWEAYLNKQHEDITELRKQVKADQVRIVNDRKGVEQAKERLESEKSVIESRQAQIKSALTLLKTK